MIFKFRVVDRGNAAIIIVYSICILPYKAEKEICGAIEPKSP